MDYRYNPQLLPLAPSASLALMDKARAMKAQGLDIISLAGGEPDFDTPAAASLAGIGAITAGQTHYTTGRGMPKLRARIARKLREVLETSDEGLFQKGQEARKFVLEQKNNVIQAQKILEMLKTM